MSYTELLVHGYTFQYFEINNGELIPLDIKSICCDFFGYNLCCIALIKQKVLPTSDIHIQYIQYHHNITWECERCTYFNTPTSSCCEICNYPKTPKHDTTTVLDDHNEYPYPDLYVTTMDEFVDEIEAFTSKQIIDINSDTIDISEAFYISIILGHISCYKYLEPNTNFPKLNTATCCPKPLWIAAKYNSTQIMQLLLQTGLLDMDPNEANINCDYLSPLMIACSVGSIQAVHILSNLAEIQINAKSPSQDFETRIPGCTALIIASQEGHIECVQQLLMHKDILIDLPKSNGRAPLLMASFFGYIEIVQMLLDHSNKLKQGTQSNLPQYKIIDVNRGDEDGYTALFCAAQNGHLNVVKLLLQNNADVNKAESKGHTPLWISSLRGNVEVVRYLISHKNININQRSNAGVTALWAACKNGNDKVVELLLNPLTDQETKEDDVVAMYQSVVYNNQQMLLAKQNKTIQGAADPNIVKEDGCSSIWIAASEGNTECVRILLKYGADANISDKQQGATPLFVACQNGKTDVVDVLLTINVEINRERDGDGTTPIMMAIHNGHTEIVRKLLKYGADIKKVNKTGLSCIGCAAIQGRLETMKLLHTHLMDTQVNQDDIVEFMDTGDYENKWTPIMLACMQDNMDVAKYLVNICKVNVWKKDIENKTALEHAWQNGHQQMVSWLSQIQHQGYIHDDNDNSDAENEQNSDCSV